ncbi:MAG: VOC family protein [Bacteroidetes bacterium]|nr:VOC family protein [Bacteroidota bacterium]
MSNAINWFEIPASNFERAVDFYSKVLAAPIHQNVMANLQMGILPYEQGEIGGAVVKGEGYTPSATGSLIYLNGGEDLNVPLARVEANGGQVVVPKTKISDEVGYMAVFMDCEGNRMAFHSPN